MYDYITELYDLEVKNDPRYTHGDMAVSLRMTDTYLYSILSWKIATPYVKKVVEEEKISRSKACRILYRAPKGKAEKIIKDTIKHKLKTKEIDQILKKENHNKNTMDFIATERDYENASNIVRDIELYSAKLVRSLLSITSIPRTRKTRIKSALKRTVEACDNALERLRTNGW